MPTAMNELGVGEDVGEVFGGGAMLRTEAIGAVIRCKPSLASSDPEGSSPETDVLQVRRPG